MLTSSRIYATMHRVGRKGVHLIQVTDALGKPHAGWTYEDIVASLHGSSFSPSDDIDSYMHATADRLFIWHDVDIAYSNAESFVSELLRAGELHSLVEQP